MSVSWGAAGAEKLGHTGHFPIQWLQDNHYTSERKAKPQPVVAVRELMHVLLSLLKSPLSVVAV